MADGKFLDLLNAIRDLFEGLGSSTSTDDVPLVGNTQAPTPKFGRRGYGRQEKKDHLKGKIGDMSLEADGNDAPGMFQSGANTMTGFYMGRKGIDFAFKTLEMQRDKELKRGENPGGGNGGNGGNNSPETDDQTQTPPRKTIKKPWFKIFREKYPFPTKLPPALEPFLKNCPDGSKDAVFFSLLAMIGTLVYGMVRSVYRLDGKTHAPTAQVQIVAHAGSGKSLIEDLYNRLFTRVIIPDVDKTAAFIKKINSTKDKSEATPSEPRQIIQTVGFNLSQPILHQLLVNNDGVPLFVFEPELSTLLEARREGKGLTAEQLRKADDGSLTHRLSRTVSGSGVGTCTLRLSLVVTGTPGDAEEFKKKLGSTEGGNASRIIRCNLRERIESPDMVIPQRDVLDQIRADLLSNREKFCYTTAPDGEDTPCSEHFVNLGYVSDALAEWIKEQRQIAAETNDYCRDGHAWRMASRGFNLAITLHMLYGEPTSANRSARKAVIEAATYIANFCMETYLALFGEEENKARKAYEESEMVTVVVPDGEDDEDDVDEEEMSEEELAAKIIEEYQPGVTGHGWDSVADKLGLPVDRIRYLHGKYTKKNGDRSSGV